jgi:choline kinase
VKVLILCAGEQARWGDDDNPKQLVDVGGEALLDRIVRQCRQYDQEPVIVTHDPRLHRSKESFTPIGRRWTVETLYWTHPLWTDRNIVLLGDVVYSPEAFEKIIACRSQFQVFGRKELRYRIVGHYYEIFALSFDGTLNDRMREALIEYIQLTETGGDQYGKLRTLYETWCGLPLGQFLHEDNVLYPIEDWTEDIDTHEDYEQFCTMIINRGWLDAAHLR